MGKFFGGTSAWQRRHAPSAVWSLARESPRSRTPSKQKKTILGRAATRKNNGEENPTSLNLSIVGQTSSCAGHKSMPLKAKRRALTREKFNIHTKRGRQNQMDPWKSHVGFGDLAVASNDMMTSGFRFALSRRSAMGIARRNGDWYAVVASCPPQSDCRAMCVCVVVTWGPSTSFLGARSSLVSRD